MHSSPAATDLKDARAGRAEVMAKMVFVTGFARGGTSWLRDCIGAHPDIAILPRERVVFRDMDSANDVREYFARETKDVRGQANVIVNKAPANAPHLAWAAKNFPESRFIFIVRDPRDVLVSHQRGSAKWMKGSNSTVQGCMQKIQKYYQGWVEARGLPNVMIVRYEDLHQNFHVTMDAIFKHIGVDATQPILQAIYNETNFQAQTNRSNVEDSEAAKRKGVIGEWSLQLKDKELDWYRDSAFFQEFMLEHGYSWTPVTFSNILKAMHEAGVRFLSEGDLLNRTLDKSRANVVVQHDIDYLTKAWCAESVIRTAEIEAELGVPAAFNFLPLDDPRYKPGGAKAALSVIKKVTAANPSSYIGLHVNACERFYPAAAPDVGNNPPKIDQIADCVRQQVAEYRAAGVSFRISTAHGYGRAKKLPNNRDTPLIAEILGDEGILLFDTTIRRDLMDASSHYCAITDVGGVLKPRLLGNGYDLTDPQAYSSLPKGTILRFLTHPGNYPVESPATIVMRVFN
jgi:hypothetical protein